jgi:hypothetical protein
MIALRLVGRSRLEVWYTLEADMVRSNGLLTDPASQIAGLNVARTILVPCPKYYVGSRPTAGEQRFGAWKTEPWDDNPQLSHCHAFYTEYSGSSDVSHALTRFAGCTVKYGYLLLHLSNLLLFTRLLHSEVFTIRPMTEWCMPASFPSPPDS